MRTVIVALPVDDDDDIFDVAERIAQTFPTNDDDSRDAVVYESFAAIADDLGYVPDESTLTL
jgi:hypothetical protein